MTQRKCRNKWAIWFCTGLVITVAGYNAWSDTRQTTRNTDTGWEYPRHDTERIRRETDDIFSSARFRKKTSLWRRFMQWLHEKAFGAMKRTDGGWGKALFWVVTIWCILTLLAILIHLLWVLVTTFREHFRGIFSRSGTSPLHRADSFTHEQLQKRMSRLRAEGRFAEAIGFMLKWLLHTLDNAGMVILGSGKTNGDYVLDYPFDAPGRKEFSRFVTRFDGLIYSGATCTQRDFHSMWEIACQIRNHAENKKQD